MPDLLVINQGEVRRLLEMSECIGAMEKALASLARGEAIVPLRPVLWLPGRRAALGMMPAYSLSPHIVGLKAVTVFPENHGTELDSHQGAVMLFEADRGQLLALVEASSITAIRTAAVSALATRLLALQECHTLAILGSGVQAASHLEAMLRVRPINEVRVWSRQPAHAERFASRENSRRDGIRIRTAASPREAVRGAGLICTTTSASDPILLGDWLEPGMHINAVGSSVPFTRELDTRAVVRSDLFVDCRESTLHEAGDFLIPRKEGALEEDHIRGELGEVLLGRVPGRRDSKRITLFKSLGLAIEDLAAAHLVYRRALQEQHGLRCHFGGIREEG